jgi:hypothetical protein
LTRFKRWRLTPPTVCNVPSDSMYIHAIEFEFKHQHQGGLYFTSNITKLCTQNNVKMFFMKAADVIFGLIRLLFFPQTFVIVKIHEGVWFTFLFTNVFVLFRRLHQDVSHVDYGVGILNCPSSFSSD